MSESRWSGSGGAGGGGDVFGPPSSTDNAVARFDGTTGDTLQNSPVTIADNGDVAGVNDLDASTVTLPGGDVQTQLDEKIDGPAAASSTNNAIMRWDGGSGRLAKNSAVTLSDGGVIAGATIDGDDNTVQDLPLSSIKTVISDANHVLRRNSSGVVVGGPTTIDVDGNINNSKTLDLRNDDDLSGAGAYMLRMTNQNSTPGSHPFIDFQRARFSNADLQNGDEIGGLDFRPRFNGSTSTTAKLQVEYTGNGTTRLSDFVFQTSNGGAPAERMRIAADGKVTITGDFEVQGTTTTINTTNLDVEDKNIRINFGGNDTSAEGAGLSVEGTGGVTRGTIQYEAALGSKWKLGTSGAEDEVVTRTLSQTLTNKTINGANNTITNVSLTTGVTGTLPASNGGTGITSLGANIPTFLGTPSSANLAAAVTDETGSGSLVFGTTPTLDNPTIDNGATLLHETTPATPSSGRVRVYPKSDNRLYVLDSNGVEVAVGSGTAAGFVNYITNPDAESSTTGWSTYADAAASTPTDGTGGSPNVTWTRNTSVPIRGNADFAFAKDAANRQGQGVSFAFTLATTDRSKECQISFDYDTSAANYAAGDMRVYVYDVTNATLITPQTVDIPRGTNTFVTTFDTTTSTSYRLILHVATTNATAYTVDFDNFVVNAEQVVQGAAISEWQSYTPSAYQGFGTPTNVHLRYRRVGSSLEIQGRFNAGTNTAAEARVQLPPGLTISTPGGVTIPVGQTTADVGATNYPVILGEDGKQYVTFGRMYLTSTAYTKLDGNAFTTNGSLVSFHSVSIPIAEWAGNGTVNLGAGAQVEYAYNSAAWSDASDSSSFAYGPAGVAFGTTALTDLRTRRVRFQYPIQNDDIIELQAQINGIWVTMIGSRIPASGYSFQPLEYGATNGSPSTKGVSWQPVSGSTTDIDVQFGRYFSTYNGDVSAVGWNTAITGSTVLWRVRKAKASAPVGFGLVNSTDSGLLRAYNNMTLIRLHTANGFGSTNTKIRRFSTTVTNTGTGITYADSAANGASFTCTEAGIYTFTYSDSSSTTDTIGLSLNSSQLTTDLVSITAADRLVVASTAFVNAITSVTVTIRLAVNDVVRPHSGGTTAGALSACTTFTVQRIA